MPKDTSAVIDPHYRPSKLDWSEPGFDPAHPEDFTAYLTKHRDWMIRLFTAQFGAPPTLMETKSTVI
jgi:hypothetical protein